MKELFIDKKSVCRCQEHAILENEDGTYEYVAWDIDKKSGKLSWIGGQAVLLEDTLCLKSIQSEGEENEVDTELAVKHELQQLPEWDKTKYYCVIIDGNRASQLKFCDTGDFLEEEAEECGVMRERLKKHGVFLPLS